MNFKKTMAGVAAAAFMVGLAGGAMAGPVAAGFNSTALTRNDDGSYGPSVSTGFAMNFFGTTYTDVFVNNNGNITFSSNLSTFTPFGLTGPLGQAIIAPFFADVDTRNLGSGITAFGAGTYAGRDAFGVTWPAVGYFGSHADLLNTFQVILTDRSDVGAGDFDIYFNYDQMQWETGDASGGSGGFGGSPAVVGFSNGSGNPGTFFQFTGSGVSGALVDGGVNALVSHTNTGVLGQYRFSVRNGDVVVPPISGGIPEPATWAMMLTGFAAMGAMLRSSRRRASLAV